MQEKDWFKLDTVGKIYPPSSNGKLFEVNLISAIMKEDVNPEVLEDAVNEILERFPYFKVKIRRGFFWYYLDKNTKRFIVHKEKDIFSPIDIDENNDYIFEITYISKKITIGFFHALTDGTGALMFFKALLYKYLVLMKKDVTFDFQIDLNEKPKEEEYRNDYLTYFDKSKKNVVKEKVAYRVFGNPLKKREFVTTIGRLSTNELLGISRKYGVSITCFVASLIIYSIYKTRVEGQNVKNKEIKAFIPVNLRKRFSSVTMQNFVGYFRVGHNYAKDITFEDLLQSIKEQMKEKTSNENLLNDFSQNVKIEKNVFLRVAPLFIKDLALNIGYKVMGNGLHTFSLSNLGEAGLTESMQKEIDSMIMFAGAVKTSQFNANILSCSGITNICFARCFIDSKIERYFFKFLSDNGLKVQVVSDNVEKE